MYVVAITGGIGAGKTVAANHFQSKGAVVIDLDDVAKRLLDTDVGVRDKLIAEFGEGILDGDGKIDRAKLAELAFSDCERAKRLNSIVHPAVASDVMPGLTEMGLLLNPPPLVVLDVPMLVEAPVFAEFADIVLAISSPEETRVRRAVERGMNESEVRRRIACQASEEDRILLADDVIVNVGTEDEFIAALDKFWDDVVRDEH